MRRSLWSVAVAVLAFGALAMVGGTAIGGHLAPVSVYGTLLTLGGLYMVAGLAIRDRTWERTRGQRRPSPPVTDRLAGRRVF
ncbi:MAG TPA: hypothetical protein VIH24_04745 [Candidatus Limnocylindria bacterium]|jgi:hypothetical protein